VCISVNVWWTCVYRCWSTARRHFIHSLEPDIRLAAPVQRSQSLPDFFFNHGAGVQPSPLLLRPTIDLLYQPWMIDGDVCRAISGKGNQSTRRKPAPVPLSITDPNDVTQAPTWAGAVQSRRLTSWVTARPRNRLRTPRKPHSWFGIARPEIYEEGVSRSRFVPTVLKPFLKTAKMHSRFLKVNTTR
jgi:hypothetical protein